MFSFWTRSKEFKTGRCTVNFQAKAIYVVGSHLHCLACDPLLRLEPDATDARLGETVRKCINSLKPEAISRQVGYDPVAKDSICFSASVNEAGFEIRLYAIGGMGVESRDAEVITAPKNSEGIGAALRAAWQKEKSKLMSVREKDNDPASPVPDLPQPFGFKCSWLALKTENSKEVCEILRLKQCRPANWQEGIAAAYKTIAAAYKTSAFVSPPINGWTLVVARNLPELDGGKQQPKLVQILKSASAQFAEAQYFGSHRVVEYQAWAKASKGEIQRAFTWVGECGEVVTNIGVKTVEEAELGLGSADDKCPDEEDVMRMAGKWSLNPNELDKMNLPPGLGIIGNLYGPARPPSGPTLG